MGRYPDVPPTTMTFLPISLSFDFTISIFYLTDERDVVGELCYVVKLVY